MQQADVMILQILFIGAFGYIFSIVLSVMGKREFGKLLMVVAVVLCAVIALQLVAMVAGAILNFLEPVMKFLNRWS